MEDKKQSYNKTKKLTQQYSDLKKIEDIGYNMFMDTSSPYCGKIKAYQFIAGARQVAQERSNNIEDEMGPQL